MPMHPDTTPLLTHYDGSCPERDSFDINYNALPGEKYGDENAGNGGQACPPPTHE